MLQHGFFRGQKRRRHNDQDRQKLQARQTERQNKPKRKLHRGRRALTKADMIKRFVKGGTQFINQFIQVSLLRYERRGQ